MQQGPGLGSAKWPREVSKLYVPHVLEPSLHPLPPLLILFIQPPHPLGVLSGRRPPSPLIPFLGLLPPLLLLLLPCLFSLSPLLLLLLQSLLLLFLGLYGPHHSPHKSQQTDQCLDCSNPRNLLEFDDDLDCCSVEVCCYLYADVKNRAEMLNSNTSSAAKI